MRNTGHLNSADPIVWAESWACAIKFPDWNRCVFLPIHLDQLTSMTRSWADNDIALPIYN